MKHSVPALTGMDAGSGVQSPCPVSLSDGPRHDATSMSEGFLSWHSR